eukprot:TRINITY_DN261_c4_g1_i1.p1 TRINITY_DN261_c4_g1~~TRINITY_DN261_c4_g1_i1.p1  ORF type:complete len:345 (-),score=112.61 TRINITY_DN261_c4_g1_i1:158-1192(-)
MTEPGTSPSGGASFADFMAADKGQGMSWAEESENMIADLGFPESEAAPASAGSEPAGHEQQASEEIALPEGAEGAAEPTEAQQEQAQPETDGAAEAAGEGQKHEHNLTLHVGNVPLAATAHDLYGFLMQEAPKPCNIRDMRLSKGFGSIWLEDAESYANCLTLNGKEFQEQPLKLAPYTGGRGERSRNRDRDRDHDRYGHRGGMGGRRQPPLTRQPQFGAGADRASTFGQPMSRPLNINIVRIDKPVEQSQQQAAAPAAAAPLLQAPAHPQQQSAPVPAAAAAKPAAQKQPKKKAADQKKAQKGKTAKAAKQQQQQQQQQPVAKKGATGGRKGNVFDVLRESDE